MSKPQTLSKFLKSRRGFTMIEIMMAVLVISIGVLGVFAMQVVAISSNGSAHRATEATMVGDFFIERLRQDALAWNSSDATNLANTTYLNGVAGGGWQIATTEPISPLGTLKSSVDGLMSNRAVYCVAYRLDWAIPNQVLSGAVRVYWPRLSAPRSALAGCLSGGGGSYNINALDLTNASTVSAVRKEVNTLTIPVTISVTPDNAL